MSLTPSPSKSPIFATDQPNRSLLSKTGPFSVESLITAIDFTEPLEFESANASDGNWKRSEHIANNKMNN